VIATRDFAGEPDNHGAFCGDHQVWGVWWGPGTLGVGMWSHILIAAGFMKYPILIRRNRQQSSHQSAQSCGLINSQIAHTSVFE